MSWIYSDLEVLAIMCHFPQLVVCGDQSSGKSSVLEAISGVRFPTKKNLCTRFATELILRRTSNVSVSVSIIPAVDRAAEDKDRLVLLKYPNASIEQLPSIVTAVTEALGIESETNIFSDNVMRVELTGPRQLVNLPGLIHVEHKH